VAAAVGGDTNSPNPSELNGMHFICFVKGNHGRLWSLEGGWGSPFPKTALNNGGNVLREKAVQDGPERYLDVGRQVGISEFSCGAVLVDSDHSKGGRV